MSLNEILEKVKDNEIAIDVIIQAARESIRDKKYDSELVEVMKLPQVTKYIQYLVRTQINGDELREADFQCLQNIIFILQTIYNYSTDESPVSDYDYDRLYELLNSYNQEMITTPIVGNGKVVHHKYKSLRGTLKKVYSLGEMFNYMANDSRRSLDEWVAECERIYKSATGKDINLNNEEVYVFPKWDGVSIVFEFDERNRLARALTRGFTETNEAQDVTFIFATQQFKIREQHMTGKAYGLKTEVMMKDYDKDGYNKKYGTDYKNTRSIVSSIINSDTVDGRENLLEVVKLRTSTFNEDGEENLQELAEQAFERPFLRCPLSDRAAINKFALDHRNIDGLHTDGAVIYIIDEHIRKVLGRRDNKNQYEVAFKFNEDIGYTKIKDIQFNVTPNGRIFPVAKLEKIVLKGNDIQNVSLGSISRMNELKLAKGDTVKILYEIIPYLVMDDDDPKCKRSGKKPIPLPTLCPECGDRVEINQNGTVLSCINPDCPSRMRGRILKYINVLRIKDIGEATVKDLMDAGIIGEVADLYKLDKKAEKILSLKGYNEKSVAKMIQEMDRHRILDAPTFLAGIGIESIGKKTFTKVFNKYSLDELLEFSEDNRIQPLVLIPGIGESQAKKIIYGIKENRKVIDKLFDEITIIYPEEEKAKFIAVFHKIRSEELTKVIEKNGGKVDDNLTKNTTFLIVPDGFGSSTSKTSDKARGYGIPIIEFSDVPNYINIINSEDIG
jgi:NAD-dependent DNA ligase